MTADLGRRAVACKRWRWMAGMLALDHAAGARVSGVSDRFLHAAAAEQPVSDHGPVWMRIRRDSGPLPDLTDAATLGCLLALVREAWDDPTVNTHCWRVSPHVASSKPVRGPERWNVAGAGVEELYRATQIARDWSASGGWDDTRSHGAACPIFHGATEAEALVAALEAAP